MKKTLILLVIIMLSYCYSFAQNSGPLPLLFDFRIGSVQYQDHEYSSSLTPQGEFMIGWQWSWEPRSADALKSNLYQSNDYGMNYDYSMNIKNTAMIYEIPSVSQYNPLSLQNGMSVQFEPTLYISNPGKFKCRGRYDNTHAVFGFGFIKGDTSTNPLNVNYNRLILRKTILQIIQPTA